MGMDSLPCSALSRCIAAGAISGLFVHVYNRCNQAGQNLQEQTAVY